jgi:hypothetical protein
MSPWQRAVAMFVRPSSAWSDLATRSQWWFPLVLMTLIGGLVIVVLHDRALVPMLTEQWEAQVESGQLQAEQLARMEEFMGSPAGMIVTAIQQVIAWPVFMLLFGLLVWFAVGFVLGTKFRFRHAFEVVCWSSLILIPSQVLTTVLAWFKESMRGVHVGFGALLPDADTPSKLHIGLGVFLDAIGPLQIWALIVAILGATALSGAPRKSVAWVLSGLYVAVMVFLAALAGVFSPA